jgi:GT2 family glycosyltransferase
LVHSTPEDRPRLIYATVLYWQTRELPLLTRCVGSLLTQDNEQTSQFELRILLIDNGCGMLPTLPSDTRVELVRLADNHGFAGGHNVGLRQALARGAEYMLLFNSDAVAEPGCLSRLLAAADAEASAACVGPLVLRATLDERVESAGQSFNISSGRHREIARGRVAASVGTRSRRVDAISGCALFARASALQTIGLLDESLFAYFEDMDWCLRARQAGYSVMLAPAARVRHLGGGSTGSAAPLATYYSVRNHMVVAGRYGGHLSEGLALGYHVAYLVRSRERRTRQHFVALARGACDAWAGRLGARHYGASRH